MCSYVRSVPDLCGAVGVTFKHQCRSKANKHKLNQGALVNVYNLCIWLLQCRNLKLVIYDYLCLLHWKYIVDLSTIILSS